MNAPSISNSTLQFFSANTIVTLVHTNHNRQRKFAITNLRKKLNIHKITQNIMLIVFHNFVFLVVFNSLTK
ncbi:MAG: hypothetical protein CVU08_02325 [Bacteroidetes bacterium HGW-Bacteroidetes-3]|nr:MAG: hypothetical protein CVU08_02325 [Bacteroidetes bacterium HGW-Bacteroidetes-3]